MLRLDWNLVFTIINLIVLYLLMKKFLIGPVTAIMDKRQALITQQLANAGDSETQAAALKRQYEEKLESAGETSSQLVEKARLEAKAEYDRIVTDANNQAGKIIENAHRNAGAEQEKAMHEVKSQIAGLVMAAAAKVVGEKSSDSSDQALYNQYLSKAGDSHDANRG